MTLEAVMKQLSEFCVNECNAQCCDLSGLGTVFSKKDAEFVSDEISKVGEGLYNVGSCKHCQDNYCTEWDNPDRPDACNDFPFQYFDNDYVAFKGMCPFIEQKGHEIKKEFEKNGFTVINF